MPKFIKQIIYPLPNSSNGSSLFFFILHLLAQIKLLKNKVNELANENEYLKNKLRFRESQLFSPKTEKNIIEKASTENIDNQTTTEKSHKKGARKGHKGSGRKIPAHLKTVEVIKELPDQDKKCKICQEPLEETTISEISYEVDVEYNYILKKHIRKVYRKTCNCPHPIITAAAIPKISPKGKYSINFWCKVLFDKYLMQIPLHRQVFQMKIHNLSVSKGTLINGFNSLLKYLLPLYEQYRIESQKENHHHADETRWKVFIDTIGKKNFNWWLWVFAGKKVVFYIIDKSRSAKVPKEHLDENRDQILSVDRFSAYKTLSELIQLAFCWSHVRRDFTNILKRYPHKKTLVDWAKEWIKWIAQLYALNKQRLSVQHNHEEYAKIKKKLEQAVLKMQERSMDNYALPEQRQVMQSLQNHWDGLTRFVDDPRIPMDNNLAEQMLRMPVVGRKNYYGNHSESGGQFSAIMFTIMQTCIINKINPDAYLKYYLNEYAKIGGVPDDLESFMPHRLNKAEHEFLFIK